MANNYFTYDATHKKSANPTKKNFWVQTRRPIWALEQLSNAIGGGAIALVKQLTTAGFRPISKYEYIVPQLSKC